MYTKLSQRPYTQNSLTDLDTNGRIIQRVS